MFQENVPDTDTTSGHGTHVAGIAGGTGEASVGDTRRNRYYAGIAPGSKLVGISVGEGINILFALEGFDYALANQQRYGIDVITNSWGTSESVYDPDSPVNRASYEAYRRGMVVAFAAGNDGPSEDTINPYALVPWVISVGSGTKIARPVGLLQPRHRRRPYKHVDLIAPGSDICSTRAPLTALGALGPVVNPTTRLHALLHLHERHEHGHAVRRGRHRAAARDEPSLSPDQIETILVQSAQPMPQYPYHWVGGGYIDVLAAVDLASRTTGTRQGFLQGVTAWSSAGQWQAVADSTAQLAYTGTWTSTALAGATDGTYRKASVTKKSVPRIDLAFYGQGLQLKFPRDSKGGLADVYVDGANVGTINFYSATATTGGRFAVPRPRSRAARGAGARRSRATCTSMARSPTAPAGDLIEDRRHRADLHRHARSVGAEPRGRRVPVRGRQRRRRDQGLGRLDRRRRRRLRAGGSRWRRGGLRRDAEQSRGAGVRGQPPGTYKYRVKGYATVLANYTINGTVSRAVVTAQ
jgi:subtilisin family serine protease